MQLQTSNGPAIGLMKIETRYFQHINMRLRSVFPIFAALASAVNAKVLLARFHEKVAIGNTYAVEWLQNVETVSVAVPEEGALLTR